MDKTKENHKYYPLEIQIRRGEKHEIFNDKGIIFNRR